MLFSSHDVKIKKNIKYLGKEQNRSSKVDQNVQAAEPQLHCIQSSFRIRLADLVQIQGKKN